MNSELFAFVQRFAKEHDYYKDPHIASGCCYKSSEKFYRNLVAEFGLHKFEISAIQLSENKMYVDDPFNKNLWKFLNLPTPNYIWQPLNIHFVYEDGCAYLDHWVLHVDGYMIDFTAKQFGRRAPFPFYFNYRPKNFW